MASAPSWLLKMQQNYMILFVPIFNIWLPFFLPVSVDFIFVIRFQSFPHITIRILPSSLSNTGTFYHKMFYLLH